MVSKSWLMLGLLLALNPVSHALASRGGEGSGGGDLCEDRIKTIRDDLKNWIQQGGPSGLTLPNGISRTQYSDEMLAQIDTAKIRCVGPKDQGFPVAVEGTPKVCRFDQANGGSITCDYLKFMATAESQQYVLIHHEYAGLADIERPNRDDSIYTVSNQITDFLVDKIVKQLAVKPATSAHRSTDTPCAKPRPNAAAFFQLIESPQAGAKEIDLFLTAHVIALDAVNEQCETPVQASIRAHKLEIYKDLYQRSHPDLDSSYEFALRHGDLNTIQFIKKQGGKLTYDEYKRQTPLMLAAADNSPEVVEELLKEPDARINAADWYGRSALMYASQSNTSAVVELLIQAGVDVNHETDADNRGGSNGRTALIEAAQDNPDPAVVNVLINAGAKLNSRDSTHHMTPFLWACVEGRWPVVKALLDAGAQVSDHGNYGDTALMIAVRERGVDDLVRGLISAGIDVNAQSTKEMNHYTALIFLVEREGSTYEEIKRLIDAGASLDDLGGGTAYQHAVSSHRSQDILNLLKPSR